MSPIAKFALPALAVAGTAYAACSASATTTIQNSGDAAAFTSCRTFSGSIAVETGATENINLDGIQKLDGNLVINNNTQIGAVGGNSLEEITGTFRLDTLESLTGINFPKLKSVRHIEWLGLSRLDTIGFDAEVEEAEEIRIENTFLSSLKGINVETVKKITLANNKQINDISMQLGSVTESLTLADNNPDVNVTLPNLIWAFNMTFRNCSSVDVPSLESLNGSLGLYSNVFTSFNAPNLTEIGGALAIVSNTEMTNISLPELTLVKQNLEIANNTKLSKINGLPKLKQINGALDFNGNMSEVSLPALNNVKGAFNLQSTGDIQGSCDNTFKPLKDKGRLEGKYVCVGSVANPGGQGSSPTVTGANAKKTGAASSVTLGSNALFAGLAAAFFL